MIGVDAFYFWLWEQYASCMSTLKVGCRQSIIQLRLEELVVWEQGLLRRFQCRVVGLFAK